MLACPSEYSGAPLAASRYREAAVPSRIGSSSRVSPATVVPYLVRNSRFAVGRIPRLCGLPMADVAENGQIPAVPLVEFSFRLGLCPVPPGLRRRRSAAEAPLMDFFSPSAHAARKVHFVAGFACPLRSTLRVWLPSRWFAPFEALPALFRADSAHGKFPSELSPPKRFPNVSARANSLTVSSSGFSAARRRRPGPMVHGS